MTPAQFQKLWESKLKEIQRYAKHDLPQHIGKLAVDHYKQNFRLGGYVDDKLKPWTPSKRIGQGKSAAAGYGTLLSSRVYLMGSIIACPAESKVVISSSLKYSRIHNEGGQIPVTPKMRKYAWFKYYEENPEGKGEAGGNWKGLALTKKTVLIIPKRQYMGKSIELNRQIQERIRKDVLRILTG